MSRFEYTPLDPGEIRLLWPVDPDESLGASWTLRPARLFVDGEDAAGEQLEFDALSYTWGDPTSTYPLKLFCEPEALKVTTIHHNLNQALPYLWRRGSTRPLWIDALCINQADDEEKTTQIPLMNRIYRSASEVWIWFGAGTGFAKEAVALLPRVVEVGGKYVNVARETLDSLNVTLESEGFPPLSSPIWTDLRGLLENRWFTRLWTVQEAALPRTLKCLFGDQNVDWALLERAEDLCNELNKLPDEKGDLAELTGHYNVFYARNVTQEKQASKSDASLHDDLASAAEHLQQIATLVKASHQCYDPRDRVFGVLGFVSAAVIHQAQLDEPGLSLTELYTRFCWFLLRHMGLGNHRSWYLLNMACKPDKLPGLPSWCPDFDKQRTQGWKGGYGGERFVTEGRAGRKGDVSRVAGGPRPRDIVLRGVKADSVVRIFPESQITMREFTNVASLRDFAAAVSSLGTWEKAIAEEVLGIEATPNDYNQSAEAGGAPQLAREALAPTSTNGREPSLEVYAQTLVARYEYQGFADLPALVAGLQSFRTASERWTTLAAKVELSAEDWEKEALRVVEEDLAQGDEDGLCTRRRVGHKPAGLRFLTGLMIETVAGHLFMTSSGWFGLAWGDIAYGDELVVFDWSRAPFLVRRVAGRDDEAYQLISQAFVSGLMGGEAYKLDIQSQGMIIA